MRLRGGVCPRPAEPDPGYAGEGRDIVKPDTTYIAARILGPLLVVAGIMLITQNHRMMAALGSFMLNDAILMTGGFLSLIGGLVIVTLHNRYDSITAIIVSLIGWMMTLRGGVLLLAPTVITQAADIINRMPSLLPITGCVMALLGVFLSYTGYIAGTLRVETVPK